MQLQPWQQKMIVDIESGGFKSNELMVVMSGRQTGKSLISQYYQYLDFMKHPYKCLSESKVDGEIWYTVTGQKPVCEWIRKQDATKWHEHIDSTWHISFNTFDIHERIYTMLGMKFL